MTERTEKSERLERVWRSLPKHEHGLLPPRLSLKAANIPDLLPDISIAQVMPSSLMVLLTGSHITARINAEITGQDYLQYVESAQRAQVLAMLQTMCHRPVAGYLHVQSRYSRGYTQALELTMFPICDKTGDPNYIVSLAIPMEKEGPFIEKNIRGEIASSDWRLPANWIDLGAGIPAS